MADLRRFQELVTIYRKRQDTSAGTPHTQKELANAIGLSADELGHRLRGSGRILLTQENVLAIVRTLFQWETLSRDEAVHLLTVMDYPLDSPDWQAALQHVLVPPSQPANATSDEKFLKGFERIENAQERHYLMLEKSNDELHSMIATLSQQINNITPSMIASGAGSQKVYQVAIDQANIFLDQFKPKSALATLEALRESAWEGADQVTRWKILNNIGAAKFQLNEDQEAAQFLIEAARYHSDDEKVLCNLALAYLLLEDFSKSEHYIKTVLQKNAANERAYALRVRLRYLQRENLDGIIEQVPEELRNLPEIASALGEIAGKDGNLQICQYWNEIAYKSNDASPEAGIAYATAMLFSIKENNLVLSTGKVSQYQKTQLENIAAIYTNAYTKIADSDLLSLKLDCLFNRGIAWRLAENFEKAERDFDRTLELAPGNEQYIFYRAEVAFVSNERKRAISLFESIKESQMFPAVLLLAQAYQEASHDSLAIEVLRNYIAANPSSKLKEPTQQMLVQMLLTSERYSDADKESVLLLTMNQEGVLNLLLRSSALKAIGEEKASQENRLAAQRLVSKVSPFPDILALAEHLYSLKEYALAIPYYELIVDASIHNFITFHLLLCYQAVGKEKEALHICTLLGQNYGLLVGIAEIEAYIHEGTGNLEKAKEICTEYLKDHPDDLNMQIRLAVIHFRTQTFEELDVFLMQTHLFLNVSVENGVHLSHLLSSRGFSTRALEMMYEIRRKFFGDENAHLQYISIFLRGERENEQILKIERVTENTVVFLRDKNGNKRFYIIEDRKDADMGKHELNTSHRLAKILLGKKVGEGVVLAESVQKKEGIIEEIKSKYVHALHESTSILETDFPDARGFSIFNLDISQTPGEGETADFSALFAMLDRHYERFIQIIKIYKDEKLTIGTLAKLLRKNPVEVWGMLINNPDIGIGCAVGNFQEFMQARHLLTTNNPRFIADIFSLMTLYGLGVADEITRLYGKIGVARSVVDQIILLINSRKGLGENGFMTVGKEGNSYLKEEISAEQIKKNTEYLQGILNWVGRECEIIPCDEALTIDSGRRQQLYDIFGSDAIDSILLAKQEGRLLLSEDERLRSVAKNFFAVDGVWTQIILEQMINKEKIDNATYQRHIIKLIFSNYHHTIITVDTIEEAAKQSFWKPDAQFVKVAGMLSGEHSNNASAVEMAAHFIYKLYTQQLFLTDPSTLLFTTLDLLFKSRGASITLLAQLIHRIRIRFSWLPARQQEIERLIQQWAQGQSFF